MKKVLILGAGNAQIDAIEYCHEHGIFVAGCSYTTTDAGIPLLDAFEQVDIKVSAERITRAGGYKGTLDISQRYCDGLMPHALNYETTRYQTRREVENQQISILERIAADCMAMADFIKKTQ